MTKLVVAFGILVVASPAHSVVLCAKSRGDGTFSTTIKIRETCKPSEQQLDPTVIGLQGPRGLQGPPGDQGPQGEPGPSALACSIRLAPPGPVSTFTAFCLPDEFCVTGWDSGAAGTAQLRACLDTPAPIHSPQTICCH